MTRAELEENFGVKFSDEMQVYESQVTFLHILADQTSFFIKWKIW